LPQEATKQRWTRSPVGLGGRKDIMKQTDANGKQARERRQFDETYKRHVVDLTLLGGRPVAEIAQELGVSAGRLYAWRRQYAPRPPGGGERARTLEEAETENSRLRAEIVRLQERELVLKKSLGILSETPGRGMPKCRR
jgi:transposase